MTDLGVELGAYIGKRGVKLVLTLPKHAVTISPHMIASLPTLFPQNNYSMLKLCYTLACTPNSPLCTRAAVLIRLGSGLHNSGFHRYMVLQTLCLALLNVISGPWVVLSLWHTTSSPTAPHKQTTYRRNGNVNIIST